MRAEQLTDPIAYHGEGPVWDAASGRVLWVDLLAGDVLATTPDGSSTRRVHVAEVAACVVPRHRGGLAVATARGFVLLDADWQTQQAVADLWDDPGVRMNDGACDAAGRFFCGSMASDIGTGRGSLYRLNPDGSSSVVWHGVTISNGLGWSPDGSTAYYVDSPTGRIDSFDYDADAGTFSGRRTFAAIPEYAGAPDGLTVDAEGGVWVALWGGGTVHRYSPAGRLDAVVEVVARQTSSCTFGGEHLDQLFITTSNENLAPGADPLAGALFTIRPGVVGQPTLAYGG